MVSAARIDAVPVCCIFDKGATSVNGPEVLVVVEVLEVRDQAAFDAYRAEARQQSSARGGMTLARESATFEGDAFGDLMVQRWPSEAIFRSWQESDEYRPLLERRRKAADLRLAVLPLS
ncbi:DUF1330 domain-containing protein [Rhizorhabdus dicambivorans]|uniref:DUF1330 domain-containing protein n=1 Tax=Rhizorhabdus dicambivorans TaxID=1850238 RepID=A0A2A4FWL0_9SPHN|nr:DUF1330 domain-containing protein [Rhizorhabdus dicambivorans]PCE42593.1 DUF1330 domain-containing protein [Rhizorhabdus dicambivorans]